MLNLKMPKTLNPALAVHSHLVTVCSMLSGKEKKTGRDPVNAAPVTRKQLTRHVRMKRLIALG